MISICCLTNCVVYILSNPDSVTSLLAASLYPSYLIFAIDCYLRHGSVELTVDEKALVLQQLPTGVSHTEVDAVLTVLGQILTGSTAANEEDIGEQDQVR